MDVDQLQVAARSAIENELAQMPRSTPAQPGRILPALIVLPLSLAFAYVLARVYRYLFSLLFAAVALVY
jgi:hypothetical protein